jgi:hypothetical protein
MTGVTEVMAFRLTPEEKRDLERLAKEDMRPVGQYLRVLIRREIEHRAKVVPIRRETTAPAKAAKASPKKKRASR